MKTLIVYDSVYGNTEQIAKAIAGALAPSGEAKLIRAGEANPSELESVGLLIVGSPTQGGRPISTVQAFLNKVVEPTLKDMKVAAFDTRVPARWVVIFGFAAKRIANNLKKKGGNLIASPEGFFVKGGKGPLQEGELERAAGWARGIADLIKATK